MKAITKGLSLKLFVLFACLCSGIAAMAQDGGSTTQSSTSVSHSSSGPVPADPSTMWYMNPIVWVAGGVILLIIIIMAARSGKNTVSNSEVSRTTTTSTTIRED
jgi:hypothetical protein